MSEKKYSFWYSDVFTHRGYFTADSVQEADEMIRLLNGGEMSIDDLPGFKSEVHNYEFIAEAPQPVSKELFEDKISSDFLTGTPPKDIRSRYEGLIPSDQMDEILDRVSKKYSQIISWED
jgi:hypothetical protein